METLGGGDEASEYGLSLRDFEDESNSIIVLELFSSGDIFDIIFVQLENRFTEPIAAFVIKGRL